MTELVQILVVFAGMLLLTRLRVPLGLALLLGGVVLDLWAVRAVGQVAADCGHALARPELWLLLLITTLILEFGHFMARKENAEAIAAAARRWGGRHGRAMSLMVMPAVLGLVPMPGGALFSAPLVNRAVHEKEWASGWKSAVNYWFRHVWEYWWPLYPVVIVSLPIFQMETWKFVSTTIWYTPIAFLSGYFFLVRPHLSQLAAAEVVPPREDVASGALFVPLLLILAGALLLPEVLRHAWPGLGLSVRKMLAMLIGMLAGLVMVMRASHGRTLRAMGRDVWTAKTANILVTLGGVLVFESLLQSSGLLPVAGETLAATGIPQPVVASVLPLVAGLVTGIAVGFAGTAFPLVVGLMAAEGSSMTPMATLTLAFGFGYAGMMLSPVHLCFVLTRDFFSASFSSIYRQILPCVAVLLVASVGMYFLLQRVGW